MVTRLPLSCLPGPSPCSPGCSPLPATLAQATLRGSPFLQSPPRPGPRTPLHVLTAGRLAQASRAPRAALGRAHPSQAGARLLSTMNWHFPLALTIYLYKD